MNNPVEIEEFLKYYAKIYKQNPNLPIVRDTIYHGLATYGISADEQQNKSIKYMFSNWINHFQNSNLHVYESDMQKRFLQFHTSDGRTTEGHVKIYATFAKEDMESCVIHIFDYISQNNFATYSKVSDVVRADSVVLRMVNPSEADKVINFINNDPYLSSKARKTNPFLMKAGVVGIASDKNLSYNSTVAYLITKYFKETTNYDNVNFEDFKLFAQKYFNDVFINQTKLQDFIYDEEFLVNKKRFNTDGEALANYYEVFKLINMSLNKYTNMNDFYNHVLMTQNKESFQRLSKYYDVSIRNLENKPVANSINKKELLDQYIEYAIKKYNGIDNTLNYLKTYINGNPNAITRDNDFRTNFAKYLSPKEIINITNGNIESYVQSFMPNMVKNNDNLHELFIAAITATYNKYGFNHAEVALIALITKNDACHITNGDQNYRKRLLKYSHEEILKEFKDLAKDYISNNSQDVYSYVLLTILNKKYNNENQKENIVNNSPVNKLPYYLQKVIKIIVQNSDINLTNKLVQEFLQGNISSIKNIHDEDFKILKSYSQEEIQNAMYTLIKGYNHDSNQSLINYICTLNLEPKISNKRI